jgi:hypothetical protein
MQSTGSVSYPSGAEFSNASDGSTELSCRAREIGPLTLH